MAIRTAGCIETSLYTLSDINVPVFPPFIVMLSLQESVELHLPAPFFASRRTTQRKGKTWQRKIFHATTMVRQSRTDR